MEIEKLILEIYQIKLEIQKLILEIKLDFNNFLNLSISSNIFPFL